MTNIEISLKSGSLQLRKQNSMCFGEISKFSVFPDSRDRVRTTRCEIHTLNHKIAHSFDRECAIFQSIMLFG